MHLARSGNAHGRLRIGQRDQMGAAFVDTVIVSGGYLLGAHIGGIIGQALGFELPVVGYLLGSLIGTAFCVVYNIGKKKLISFCVDTGFTCFGLVEQNYSLPEDVLHELGVETIPIPRTQVERIEIPRVQPFTTEISRPILMTLPCWEALLRRAPFCRSGDCGSMGKNTAFWKKYSF